MPARKSNASIGGDDEPGLSVEDLNLPKTMVNRLAKGALPANFSVQSVAQSAISKSATVFVNYLTAHASDIAARQNKKTIQPKDVLDALRELEFDMFVKRTNDELIKYTEIQCTKRNSYRRRVKDEKRAQEGEGGEADGEGDASGVMGPDGSMLSTADGPVSMVSTGAAATTSGSTTNGHSAAAAAASAVRAGASEPAAKRARMDAGAGADVEEDEDEADADDGDQADEGLEEEDDDDEEDEDEEDEGEDGEREDLLEEREEREDEDEAMEGEESD
ncbi:histone-fold-containing protein [Phyllosticta capitalensis]